MRLKDLRLVEVRFSGNLHPLSQPHKHELAARIKTSYAQYFQAVGNARERTDRPRHGIARDRLEARGYGRSRPLVPADPFDGRNRRVQVTIIGS